MRTTIALLACCVLCGCSTVRPTPDELARFRTVTVVDVVEQSVTYSGSLPSEYEVDQGSGLMSIPILAPIGFVVDLFNYGKTQKRKSNRLKEIFADADIDVIASVRQGFEKLTPGLVSVSDSGSAEPIPALVPIDAQIELRVSYGLSNSIGLGTDWTPWLEVDASMVDQAGKTLWNTTVEVTVGDGRIRPLPFPDPFHDPGRLSAQYEEAVEVACRRLIADMIGAD